MSQVELTFDPVNPDPVEPEDPRIGELLRLLESDTTVWRTAAQIANLKGWDERLIRGLAEHSQGKICSGPRGYKLTEAATHAEIMLCMGRLRSQAEKMHQRSTLWWNTWLIKNSTAKTGHPAEYSRE